MKSKGIYGLWDREAINEKKNVVISWWLPNNDFLCKNYLDNPKD